MKHIIKIISLSFIINYTQILANDLQIETDSDQSIDANNEPQIETNSDQSIDTNKVQIDINRVQAELQSRLARAEHLPSGPHNLAQFYRSRQYRPVWIDKGGISEAAEYARDTFENAEVEGLDPNDYKQAVQAVDDAEKNPEKAAEAELILTKTALRYIDDVNGNRLNRQKITKELFLKKSAINALKIFVEKMNADPSGAWLESYTIDNPQYQALKWWLEEYRQILQESPYKDSEHTRKIKQIIINMERWRWFPEKMPDRYALINIPAFDLKCVDNGNVVLEMPVVVGKQERKTPVFTSTVASIRFNPSWNLPHHIAVEDSLPKIQANPGYVDVRKYVLTNSAGQVIDPYKVNWSSVNPSNFGYHIRQIPGSHNALGKIRFGLTNSHLIYLHDTATPEDFDKPVRTESSGCIRVKQPAEFAAFLFNDPHTWPLERIKENMEGTVTKEVPLAPPHLPVIVAYFTTWEDEAGEIHFADDVYSKDQQLIQAIRSL